MAFPAHRLPTTSHADLSQCLTSVTHPSLPRAASTYRSGLRNTLKKHKRVPASARPAHLHDVLISIKEYLPYLLTLDAGLGRQEVSQEEVDVVLVREPELEWRAMLAASLPGREPPRVKLRHFDHEVLFVLSTLATTHYLLGRVQLRALYDAVTPTAERRAAAVSTAMQQFLAASSIFAYLAERGNSLPQAPPAGDINPSVLGGLAAMCLAEATLAAVLKDDPYPATVTQERNVNDKEWMYVPPTIPKVRAHLFARICMAAADHATRAAASLAGVPRLDDALARYIDSLKKTARAKAFRFQSINADLTNNQGECVGWLQGAQRELGLASSAATEEKSAKSAFSRFRMERAEKKEDKRIEKGIDWGSDAGRFEEGRVVDMLITKAVKTNDTVYHHPVPPYDQLLTSIPSGREYHTLQPFTPQLLDGATLTRLRAPPESAGLSQLDLDDASSDEG